MFQGTETTCKPGPLQNAMQSYLIISHSPLIVANLSNAFQSSPHTSLIKVSNGIQEMQGNWSHISNGQAKKLHVIVIRSNLVDSYAEISSMYTEAVGWFSNLTPKFHRPDWNISEKERVIAYLIDFDAMTLQLKQMKLSMTVQYHEFELFDMTLATNRTTDESFDSIWSKIKGTMQLLQEEKNGLDRSPGYRKMLDYLLRLPPTGIPNLPSLSRPITAGNAFKIVGISQVRNEEQRIREFVKAFQKFVDEMLFLDDSTDQTANIAAKLGVRVVKRTDVFPESQDKGWHEGKSYNFLLNWARNRKATHVIFLDADEVISAGLAYNNLLRALMSNLDPGEAMKMKILHPYKGHTKYIRRATFQQYEECPCFFAVSGASYPMKAHHIQRVPPSTTSRSYDLTMFAPWYGVIHFKFSNMEAFYAKTDWYKVMEAKEAGATSWWDKETPKQIIAIIKSKVKFYESKTPRNVELDELPAWTFSNDQNPKMFYGQRVNDWRINETRYLLTNFHGSVASILHLHYPYKPY